MKIGIKYNQQCAVSDHATIRRSTTNLETTLPELTKTIVLQKIKAYEKKQSAKQALWQLVKIATSETPGEKPPLRINTEPEFKVEIRRKTPSSSQESSPRSSKRSSDDGTASPGKKRKSLPWKERLFFTPTETLTPEWRKAQQAKIPPPRQAKMSTDSDVTIKPGPYDLPEDLQEYEGMQLADPSTTPELWEGPLPVPRPQTPSKQTPIEDITEDVFIEPRTPNPEPEEAYPDDLYMEEEIPEPEEHHKDEPMDTGKDPDPPEPPQLIAAPIPPTQKTTQTKTTEHVPSGGGYFPPMTTQKK
jgi:hypothetical protein